MVFSRRIALTLMLRTPLLVAQRRTLAFLLLSAGFLLVPPKKAEAQTKPPPGAVPACENARYVQLRTIPYRSRTPEEAAEFAPLERACSQGLAAYYQSTAAASALRSEPLEARFVRDREPAEALVWSLLIPGAGQIYNRQPLKGVTFFVVNVVGWYALITASGNGTVLGANPSDDTRRLIRGGAIGLVVGSFWGSLFDAVRSAR